MQDEIKPVQGKKQISTSKGLIIVFAAAVILFGGAYTWATYTDPLDYDSGSFYLIHKSNRNTNVNGNSNANANANANQNRNTNNSNVSSSSADWKAYRNDTYGFGITFTDPWVGYRLKPVDLAGTVKTFYVNVPTTDSLYAAENEMHYGGYAAPFAISVINKSEWQDDELFARDFGSKLGENDSYVFTGGSWQACPTDLCESAIASSITAVMDSFTAFAI